MTKHTPIKIFCYIIAVIDFVMVCLFIDSMPFWLMWWKASLGYGWLIAGMMIGNMTASKPFPYKLTLKKHHD